MSDTFKPAEAMNPPTPIRIEVHTSAAAASPNCCSCIPPSASPDVHAVHVISIAILILHIVGSVVLSSLLFMPDRVPLYTFAVFPAIFTSAVVMCGACDSKSFYVIIALLYAIAGTADILVSVDWFINGYLDGEVRIMFGLVPVGGAIVTLLGTAMAFKAACTWEKARALPGPEAPAPVHAV